MKFRQSRKKFITSAPGLCTMNIFIAVIIALPFARENVATDSRLDPSLIFASKTRSLPLEGSLTRGSTWVVARPKALDKGGSD
jgi:hypothetical protein